MWRTPGASAGRGEGASAGLAAIHWGPPRSDGPHQGPRECPARWGGCEVPRQAPDWWHRAGQSCPAPPPLAPAQQRAAVAACQAADRARLSVWTTQPPAALLLGLSCFPLAGPELVSSCRRWGQHALPTSCSPAADLTRASFPGGNRGPAGAWAVPARRAALPQHRHAGACRVGVQGTPAHRLHGVQEEQGCPTRLGDLDGPPQGCGSCVSTQFGAPSALPLARGCESFVCCSLSFLSRPPFLGGRGCLPRKVRGHFPPARPPRLCWFGTEAPALGREGEQPRAFSVSAELGCRTPLALEGGARAAWAAGRGRPVAGVRGPGETRASTAGTRSPGRRRPLYFLTWVRRAARVTLVNILEGGISDGPWLERCGVVWRRRRGGPRGPGLRARAHACAGEARLPSRGLPTGIRCLEQPSFAFGRVFNLTKRCAVRFSEPV